MPGFPAEEGSFWRKLAWYLYPVFPSTVITVIDKTEAEGAGEDPGEDYYDEEIEYLFKSDRFSVLRLRRGDSARTIATLGDPLAVARIVPPAKVFGGYTTSWLAAWFVVIYSVYLFMLMSNMINATMLSVLAVFVVYIVSVRTFRFKTPSIRSVVLHEVGVASNLPLYAPGPKGQSVLSMSEVLRSLRAAEVEIREKMVGELLKDLEAQREVNSRLRALIARIERQSDMIYDMSHRLAEYLSKDYIERLSRDFEAQLARARRFYLLMAIAMLVLGAVIGITLASGLGVSLSPPPQTVTPPR